MGALRRLAKVFFITVMLMFTLYLMARCAASMRQRYSWSEMDWSQKGSTSLSDFFMASDIGRRTITKEGGSCIEYYSYKDGLPVKVICSK